MSRSICHELHGGNGGRQQSWKHDVGHICNVVKYPLWLNQAVDVLTSSSSTENDIQLAVRKGVIPEVEADGVQSLPLRLVHCHSIRDSKWKLVSVKQCAILRYLAFKRNAGHENGWFPTPKKPYLHKVAVNRGNDACTAVDGVDIEV